MIIFKGGHFMTEGLKWTVNEVPKSDDKHLELMSEENVKKANEFHKSFQTTHAAPPFFCTSLTTTTILT